MEGGRGKERERGKERDRERGRERAIPGWKKRERFIDTSGKRIECVCGRACMCVCACVRTRPGPFYSVQDHTQMSSMCLEQKYFFSHLNLPHLRPPMQKCATPKFSRCYAFLSILVPMFCYSLWLCLNNLCEVFMTVVVEQQK